MTRVSLITASWNSAATIGDTLDSVAEQTYKNIEHIVVDGGSTDATMAIVADKGGHCAKVVSEKDKGIYDAYNKGLKMVSGDIIGFMNSDDFYHTPDVIEKMVRALEDPAIDAVHADMVYVDQQDTDKVIRHWRGRECTATNLARGFIPGHPSLFLRRSVYDRVGEFNLKYRLAADYDFMLRTMHVHKVASRYVDDLWIRMRVGGATGGNFASIKKQNDEIRDSQKSHGLGYPESMFYLHKLLDRSLQRLRGRQMKFPPRVGNNA
jgi:glycosyltransferase involved in cell wall biosynthesis